MLRYIKCFIHQYCTARLHKLHKWHKLNAHLIILVMISRVVGEIFMTRNSVEYLLKAIVDCEEVLPIKDSKHSNVFIFS